MQWKPIPGYEGIYSISYCGQVFSHRVDRLMKQETTRLGYKRVGLHKEGRRTRLLVHVLVANAYIERPDWATEVNHLDGNKDYNSATNLEWSTRSKNLLHAFKTGLIKPIRGEENHFSKLTEKEVIEIKTALETPYLGILRFLGKKYNVVPEAIGLIKSGKNWGHVKV